MNCPENILTSEKHERVVNLLVKSFRANYNDADHKIKSVEIIEKLKVRNYRVHDAEIRELIGFIRRNDLCAPGFILSDHEGYWYSEDENEMKKVWESQHGRAIEIMTNFAPLHKRFKHLITGKNSLFI